MHVQLYDYRMSNSSRVICELSDGNTQIVVHSDNTTIALSLDKIVGNANAIRDALRVISW